MAKRTRRIVAAVTLSVALSLQMATPAEAAQPVHAYRVAVSPPSYPYQPRAVRVWWNSTHPMHQVTGSQAYWLTAYLNAIVRARVLAYLVAVHNAQTQTCSSPSSCAALSRRAFEMYAPAFASGAPAVMYCESGGNPRASNGGRFLGLYQQMAGAWSSRSAAYGMSGRSVFDPWANAVVSAHMVAGDGGWAQWSCRP